MDDPPPNPFTTSPSPSPAPSRLHSPSPKPPSKPSSTISAASGSPPPTHRASFPDPAKEPKRGSSRLSGPIAKVDFCCERDKEIHRGEEISIVDAFKTTEGGKASYITYVIKLGVSCSSMIFRLLLSSFSHIRPADDTRPSYPSIKLSPAFILS